MLRWCLILFFGFVIVDGQEHPSFLEASLPTEKRVDAILAAMTVDEKIAALETSTAVPRLGIPNAGASEGLHGLVQSGGFGGRAIPTTTFPEVIGLGHTWDRDVIQQVAAAEAYEARYISQNPKYKKPVLVVWAPNADLARDPRWGRNNESYGEDPFFDGTMVTAFVKGLQGDNPKYWMTASLLKHFLANSNETTRGHSSSNFDEQLFSDYYSLPFRMGFEEGGAKCFMASYNAWNHVPMTVNPVLESVVVNKWEVDGIISSDATAVEQLVGGHKYIKTEQEAIAAAIKAGIGQFLTFNPHFKEDAKKALEAHLYSETDLDNVLKGKFRVVIRLGLLDPPEASPYSRIGTQSEPEPWTTEKHKKLALDVARESVVLLKNSNGALPLDSGKIRSIAVIGPRANDDLIDIYGGLYPYSVTPLEGIKKRLGSGIAVRYAANESGAAVAAAKDADVAIVVVGNHPLCGDKMSIAIFNPDTSTKPCADVSEGREGRDRESIDLPQEKLIQQVYAANPRTIVVLVSSFPYAINWTQDHVPAILHIAHASQEEGTALADVLFGDYNPGGHLTQTWPKSLEQLPGMEDYDIRHGRTYMYFKGEPLYPFGFGLSYTKFEFSNLRFSAENVSVDVANTGKMKGSEVAQVYFERPNGSSQRPRKELEGFERVELAAGEKKRVQISLRHEPAPTETATVVVGDSSRDERLRTTWRVNRP